MRKKAIIIYLALISFLLIFFIFFLENIAKRSLIHYFEQANGAKVEIKDLSIQLSPLGITINKLQIANKDKPFENLLEAEELSMSLKFSSLLKQKFIIENLTVLGVKTQTVRKTSGLLEKKVDTNIENADKIKSETNGKNDEAKSKEKKFEIDLSTIVDENALAVNQKAEELKTKLPKESENVLAKLKKTDEIESELAKLEEKLKEIKTKNFSDIKDLKTLQETINELKQLEENINQIKARIKEKQKLADQHKTYVQNQINQLNSVAKNDYEKIVNTVDYKKYNSNSFSNTLLKGGIEKEIRTYLSYYEFLQKIIKQSKAKKTKKINGTQEFNGTVVYLNDTSKEPKLWIKRTILSGQSADYPFKLIITDISSNQNKTKALTTATLTTQKDSSTLLIEGIFDTRGKELISTLNIDSNNISISNQSISKAKLNSKGTIQLIGSRLDGKVVTIVDQLTINTKTLNNMFLSAVLARVKNTKVTLYLNGQITNPHISINSDLDDIISNAFKYKVQEEERKLKKQLNEQLSQITLNQQKSLMQNLNSFSADSNTVLNEQAEATKKVEQEIDTEKEKIEKKKQEIENKINEEKEKREKELKAKQKELEEKAKKALEKQFNNLF